MCRWTITLIVLILPLTMTSASPDSSAYRRWIRGRVTVYGLDSDFRTGEKVLAIMTDASSGIERDLRLSGGTPLTAVIAPTQKEFNRLTAGQIPEWGIGAADVSRGLFILKSPRIAQPEIDIERVVIHEICHILLGQALKPHTADRWFDEGFAQYVSGELRLSAGIRMARSMITNQFIDLDDIDEVLTFQQDKAALAYAESRAAVAYLVDTYGRSVIASIVDSLSRGNSMDDALLAVAGIGFDEFETVWIEALKKKTRWIIFLDYPLNVSVCLLALFFAAFINARRKIRLKKCESEEEGTNGFEPREKNSPSV